MTPALSPTQQAVLGAIRKNPGVLWYEAGELAFPGRTVARVNLHGRPFRELTGRGADITSKAIDALKSKGLIRRDDTTFRYYAVEVGS